MQEELIRIVTQNPAIAEPLLEMLRLIRTQTPPDPSAEEVVR